MRAFFVPTLHLFARIMLPNPGSHFTAIGLRIGTRLYYNNLSVSGFPASGILNRRSETYK